MQKILKILKFFKTVFMFTQYIPVKSFFYNFKTKKENNVIVQRCIMNYCNYKLYRVSKNKINHSKNIIYFSNHRSWGDFMIDNVVTEYCSRFISRVEVAFILPIYTFSAYMINDVILFFRRGQTSILDFEKLIKINQNNQSGNNILVYPEGTRRAGLEYACDLKKGLIYYSYKEKSPIQFIISKNKEKILNEKKFTSENNVDVFVHYSDVYYPDDVEKYKSMQEYYDFINGEWKTTFNAVYGTDYESKKTEYERIDITKIHDNNYDVDKRLLNLIRLTIVSGLVVIPSVFIKYIW